MGGLAVRMTADGLAVAGTTRADNVGNSRDGARIIAAWHTG